MEVLGLFVVSLATAFVNDKACFGVLGAGAIALVFRHRNSPASVLGLVFTFFCMAPLLRRVHDLFHGFTPSSPILIAPHLATPLLGYLVLRRFPLLRMPVYVPLLVSSTGLIFAYCVGVLSFGIPQASIQLLQYVSGPIIFCFLVLNARELDLKLLGRWILGLGFLSAAYGLYQWASPPPWDVAWFIGAKMDTAGGKPLPFQMRTFGTLNSGSPYSYFLFFTLVAPLTSPKFRWLAPVMIAALATTLGRSAWGATVLGWVLGMVLANGRDRQKILMSFLTMGLLVCLLALPFAERLTGLADRLNSVTNIKQDNSFKDRSALLQAALDNGALDDPFGVGLGGSGEAARQGTGGGIEGIDNGFLQMIWLFGWWGTLLYLGGFSVLMIRGIAYVRALDQDEIQFLAVAMALFATNLFESAFEGIKGVMVWASLAIVTAGIQRSRESR